MLKQKNMLSFAFGLSFIFGVYVGHCILSFLLWKKKQKVITEIDLVIRNYESTAESDFDKFLYSKKKSQRKGHEWYNHDLRT